MGAKKSFLRLERMGSEGYGKWEDRFTEKACELIKLGANDRVLAIALDVNPVTVQKWRRDHPEFNERVEYEKTKVNALVAFAFFNACVGYDYTETRVKNEDGKITTETITKHQPGNPWAQIKWLQLKDRETWAEEKNGISQGNTTININNLNQINLDDFSSEEIKLAIKLGLQNKAIGTGD